DVQAFRLNVWENLNDQNRCGACHGSGGQSPDFVRMDDINLAYSAANTIVDLSRPADSRMVTKVAGGHNCWLDSDSACGDVITAYIAAWAGGVSGVGNIVELTAPALRDPGTSKNFPDDSSLFASTVHPLLTANCATCHVDSAMDAQAPFFADSNADTAYEAAKAKMDLDNPANSRLVLRLREESHNCWDPDNTGSTDCVASAALMEAAITAFANPITLSSVDPSLVTSKALSLLEGIVASGGSRYEDNVIALYQFKTGEGTTAFDTSGVNPGMHLEFTGNVEWLGGWGVDIISGRAQATTASSKKLYDLITATGEYSIEAWVVPANVSQEGPARIISYAGSEDERNFTLGQILYNYDVQQRSGGSLTTADNDEDLQATLQHVVVTYDPVNGRRIYVNGGFTDDIDPEPAGNLADWVNNFAFVLGNEVSGNKQWQGKFRLVAIHNRALSQEQITQNFDVGVGEKFFLLFSVTEHTGIPDSYVVFEVSQFDNYSYLFNKPVFISLDPTASPDNIPVAGMRIGINGKEATVGQAYQNLDTTINSSFYIPGVGQPLSDLGTVIALEKGPGADEFFLTFEVLGTATNIVLEPAPVTPAPPPDQPAVSDIGVRNFDEIDATMSTVTGVPRYQVDVGSVFTTIKQQLPTVENIEGFLSAHQMAVSQLAIEYCSALVDNNGQILRDDYFQDSAGIQSFNFSATASSAFDSLAKRDLIISPLLDGIIGTGLTTQPDLTSVRNELDSLMLILGTTTACPPQPSCDTTLRTEQIVKATCAAALGSAAMLIQ
ncbi:MAG: LamG domain-containing protein, partial [Gammaproteobacteria bacterium]|nr:LamG domain-containing protein [Gammaproteobacteria bacterium]